MVKEVFYNNGDISKFVPTPVLKYLTKEWLFNLIN
jgi:phosphopantetheine adenylyltransferase